MATKFGYVKRDATSQVNWAAVATQFTDILSAEAKVREDQKAEIDKASREMVETLQNAPTGDYVDGNQFVSTYANDAQQILLTQDRLLKQGLLNPREYATVRANLNDSNKMMFKLGEAYQEAYKLKMERMNSADPATRSQMLETWKMEQAEGLYNLKNSKALINPNNGVVSIGLWKDGKMDTNPSSYQTVPELMGNLKGTYNYYDVRDAVNTAVNDLGMIDELAVSMSGYEGGLDQVITTTSQGGKYSGDPEVLKNYKEWLGYTADAMMANPFNVTSILTNENLMAEVDGKKVPYTFTYEQDPSKRKANEIYLNRDNDMGGQPEFTEEQKAAVKGAITERLNDSVDKQIKASTLRTPGDSATKIAQGEAGKKNQKTFSMLGDMYYGDATEVAAAETYFRDLLGAQTVKKSGNKIFVTDAVGNTKEVPLLDSQGNLMPFDTFAESAVLLTGVSNIADSVDLAGGVKTGVVKSVVADPDNPKNVIFEFEGGRKESRKLGPGEMITDDKFNEPKSDDYIIGKTIQLSSMTPTGGGAGTVAPETSLAQANRYYDAVLTSKLSDGSLKETPAEKVLVPLLSPFGFKVEQTGASMYRIKVTKGDQSFVFETDGGQQALDNLLNFVKGNTTAAEADGQQAYLDSKVGRQQVSGGGLLD